jgi:hypothetical protein
LLPASVIKILEQKCNAFLWKGKADNALGAKVAWCKVTLPKQGGLGWKKVRECNIFSILRCIWSLYLKAGSLWVGGFCLID